MKAIVVMLLAGATLAACQSPEQRIAGFSQECQQMGYKPGTEKHSDCVMQLRNQAEQRDLQNLKWRQDRAEQAKKEMLSTDQPKKSVTCQNWGSVTKCTED